MLDRLRQEAQTLRSELALIRSVVDHVPAMLAYWDSSQRCVFANRAYEVWFGVTREELIGCTMAELLGPIYALNLPYIESALRGEPQLFEREIPDASGSSSLHIQLSYVPDVEGTTVRGFFVLVVDITERKRAEDELRAAKHTAERALEETTALRRLIPICAWCRKVRNQLGDWENLERFLVERLDTTMTHGICGECATKIEAKKSSPE